MLKLEQLIIKNFRGFDDIDINNLSNINLFIGKNNCGKTSILESLFLFFGISNPELINKMNFFIREINIQDINHLIYFFHKLKYENRPSFEGLFNNNMKRYLTIEPYIEGSIRTVDKQTDTATTALQNSEIKGINFNFSINENGNEKITHQNFLRYNGNNVWEFKSDNRYILYASFINNVINDSATKSNFAEIIKRNNKDKNDILSLLQNFDNNIEDIQVLPDGIYCKLKDIDMLFPINIMGDGIRRFLNIITTVLKRQSSFVCIDEIENGLHYSSYKLLWKGLIEFSNKYDIQLFITTHSIETITCLKSLLEEENYEKTRGFVKIFTVAKTLKKGYQTYGYSFYGFKDAIDNEAEIRS
ncbi:MAG: AAA family ATPase [Elusimicrobiota bacterium]|jgi:AAA15 family ATPase/GTPase|nr:AAA family ATPase [Elusimicrobiota bacterium]